MGVRSIRFHDILAVHRIEANRSTHVLWPSALDATHSARHLALASAWQDVNQTIFTFVLREKREMLGLVQGATRPDHDAWDLLRLALLPTDPEDRERAADALLEQWLAAAGSRGALRTFTSVAPGGEGQALLARQGFRQYTTEYTLLCDQIDVAPAPLPEQLEFRPRRHSDAWGIFQLYCSLAPPQVRHAEGLSSKRWNQGSRLAHALVGRWLPPREVVLADEGMIVGWVRLAPLKGHPMQRLDVMIHQRVYDSLQALLAHAMIALNAQRNRRMVCHVREYESAVIDGLQDAGFEVAEQRALLVKHAAARVTERQLLIAALRAQSLGIDAAHCRQAEVSLPACTNLTHVERPLHDRTRAN